MRRRILFACILLLILVPTYLVWADNGPHGGYTATIDACTGCHRAHSTVSISPFYDEYGNGLIKRYRYKMNVTLGSLTNSLPLEQPMDYSATQPATDQLFCLTCHFAHGTTAVMNGIATNVLPAGDSAPLRMDNRGVCQDCHAK